MAAGRIFKRDGMHWIDYRDSTGARRREVMPREWKAGAPIVYRGRELALDIHPARQPAIAADLVSAFDTFCAKRTSATR